MKHAMKYLVASMLLLVQLSSAQWYQQNSGTTLRTTNRGSTWGLVVGFSAILLGLGLSLNRSAVKAVSNMSAYTESTESHNLALAGANVGMALIYADTNWRGPVTQSAAGGAFTVQAVDNGLTLNVVSVSDYHSSPETLHDTVHVTLNKVAYNSFSLFAWFTDFEGNFFWATGDTIWGRAHSNGNIHIKGSPVFYGKVTTGKKFDPPKPGTGQNQAIFKDAYETGVAPIAMPPDFNALIGAATSGGLLYTSEIWIELTAAGTAYVRTSAGGPVADSIDLNDAAFRGAIASTGRVNIQGTVNGRLSVGSATDIRITDDLVYADRTDDIIGLVAERDVIIADTPANRNGINIDACIFARTGSFMAEGDINGHMELFGSVVQRERSKPFGTSRTLRYDTRLADGTFRPPYYPGYTTRTISIANWWESYRVMNPRD